MTFKLSIATLLVFMHCFLPMEAQNINGAWKLMIKDGKPFAKECIKILSDGYFMFGVYNADGAFESAGGGTYSIEGNEYEEIHDFFSSDTSKVRKPVTYSFVLAGDELAVIPKVPGGVKESWKRIDNTSTALTGTWRFGSRINDDGTVGNRRDSNSPRQTMKVLSGKHFQWAAFNYESKQLSGTGGGSYQLTDNQYTETIHFFSRDNSRVGMSLTFEYKLDGTDWYHKGKGTTGNPVNEVWERVKR